MYNLLKQLPNKIPDVVTSYNFTDKQSENISKLLESLFGVGEKEDMRWLKAFH
ncbi:hypothetical protein ES705_26093 [subsurface metagenome]|jgi:hypothetical protein